MIVLIALQVTPDYPTLELESILKCSSIKKCASAVNAPFSALRIEMNLMTFGAKGLCNFVY